MAAAHSFWNIAIQFRWRAFQLMPSTTWHNSWKNELDDTLCSEMYLHWFHVFQYLKSFMGLEMSDDSGMCIWGSDQNSVLSRKDITSRISKTGQLILNAIPRSESPAIACIRQGGHWALVARLKVVQCWEMSMKSIVEDEGSQLLNITLDLTGSQKPK